MISSLVGAVAAVSFVVGASIVLYVGLIVVFSAVTLAISLLSMYAGVVVQWAKLRLRKRRIIRSNLTLVYPT